MFVAGMVDCIQWFDDGCGDSGRFVLDQFTSIMSICVDEEQGPSDRPRWSRSVEEVPHHSRPTPRYEGDCGVGRIQCEIEG